MRILIVEDSRINQFIARDTLIKYNIPCDIEFAMDGEAALEHIYTHTIDLVLLDIIMPKMTGLQVLEQLHQIKFVDPPKVIMLTTISDAKILKACFDLGAVDYIKKPFEEKKHNIIWFKRKSWWPSGNLPLVSHTKSIIPSRSSSVILRISSNMWIALRPL